MQDIKDYLRQESVNAGNVGIVELSGKTRKRREAQLNTTSKLKFEMDPVSEIHYTPLFQSSGYLLFLIR